MNASDHPAPSRRVLIAFMNSLTTTTIVAALALATASRPADARTVGPSPIEIRSCLAVYEPTPDGDDAMGVHVPAGIEIAYVNRAGIAIDDVTFRLAIDDAPVDVVDHGSFTPGSVIRHVFWTGAMPVSSCRVAAVRFAGNSAFTPTEAVMTADH